MSEDVLLSLDVLDDLDRRLEREIGRLRARYQLSLDEFRGLYVSDEQVNALVTATRPGTIDDPVRSTLTIRAARPCAAMAESPRWTHLVRTFALSDVEQTVMLLALAPEVDLKYETLYAYLNDDVTRKWPTVDLAARVLGPEACRADVVSALGPNGALLRNRLIDAIEPPVGRPSRLNVGFAMRPNVVRFLSGDRLGGSDRVDPDVTGDPWLDVPAAPARIAEWRRIAELLRRRNGDAPIVAITGRPGSGRMAIARAIAADLHLPLRRCDLRALRRSGAPLATALENLALERRIEPAAVVVHGLAALADGDGRLPAEYGGLLEAIPPAQGPLIVLAPTDSCWREVVGRARAVTIELSTPSFAERQMVWSRALADAGIELDDGAIRALADRFAFTAGEITRVVDTAGDRQRLDPASAHATVAVVGDAARAQPRQQLGPLATLTACPHDWEDLVLPQAVVVRLRELTAAIQLRHVVYETWGFSRRVTTGTGVKALFAGASGTGKTMSAGVIARDAGLDLVKVSLSGLVSKYIGETEKNLDKVFASARAGNALLFFDEADALFGKRSEVKDAHDRYANIEVSYLLQCLETHDGVVVLATNLRQNIDDAFLRRLHYVVDFPRPEAAERERLWRGMFPPETPLDEDIDFGFLARQFELCGGDIRNVALDAAFLAAAEGCPIGMRQLVRGLVQQQAKQGRTVSAASFKPYSALVGLASTVRVR